MGPSEATLSRSFAFHYMYLQLRPNRGPTDVADVSLSCFPEQISTSSHARHRGPRFLCSVCFQCACTSRSCQGLIFSFIYLPFFPSFHGSRLQSSVAHWVVFISPHSPTPHVQVPIVICHQWSSRQCLSAPSWTRILLLPHVVPGSRPQFCLKRKLLPLHSGSHKSKKNKQKNHNDIYWKKVRLAFCTDLKDYSQWSL